MDSRVGTLYFSENIPFSVEDRLNIINTKRLSNNLYGHKLNYILDISNYYKMDNEISSIISTYLPEGDYETGYLNEFIDYTNLIGTMTNEEFSDIYLKVINAISLKINTIIYDQDLFTDINNILKHYFNIAQESDKICSEIFDLIAKLSRFAEASSMFEKIMLGNIIEEYNDITLIQEDLKRFTTEMEIIDNEIFNKIFVILSLRLQTIFNNLQFLGKVSVYYTEEMYSIPNSFCMNVMKLGLLTCFGIYAQTSELKTISNLFKDFLNLYDVYKDDLYLEDTGKYLITGIRDEIIFKLDEINLYSDSIYSKIGRDMPMVSKIMETIYQSSLKNS